MRSSPKEVSATTNGNGTAPEAVSRVQPQAKSAERVVISPPNMKTIRLALIGTAPYLQCRFSEKAMQAMAAKQSAGDIGTVGKRAKRAPRDFDRDFQGAIHKTVEGAYGIPASAFRQAAISACRLVGFKMTVAKLSIFIEADGFDAVDSMPLVHIGGAPEKHTMIGRNADGGADIRVRAIYKNWTCRPRITFDADQFTTLDVVNLISRVGSQVGLGEGRPDSKNSAGLGFGTFRIELAEAAADDGAGAAVSA